MGSERTINQGKRSRFRLTDLKTTTQLINNQYEYNKFSTPDLATGNKPQIFYYEGFAAFHFDRVVGLLIE